jgi:hypothetical protein
MLKKNGINVVGEKETKIYSYEKNNFITCHYNDFIFL